MHPAKIKSVVAYTYYYYRTVTTFAWQCFEKNSTTSFNLVISTLLLKMLT